MRASYQVLDGSVDQGKSGRSVCCLPMSVVKKRGGKQKTCFRWILIGGQGWYYSNVV